MLVVEEGNGESNVLRGQAGQDNLIGGVGADIMYGGTDSDYYYVDNAGDVVREYVGEGTFDVVWTNTSYPSHLGWLQFKPVRPASRAMPKSKKALKKRNPAKAGNKFVHFGGILQTAGDRGGSGSRLASPCLLDAPCTLQVQWRDINSNLPGRTPT
jgi:hypothetical protein